MHSKIRELGETGEDILTFAVPDEVVERAVAVTGDER